MEAENESETKPSLTQVKTEVATIRQPSLPTSEIKTKTLIRLKTCRTLLQNVLTQDPKKNSDEEFVLNCQKWKELLSVPDHEISLEAVEKCEAVLMEKLGELDEIDLKILEINCKYSLLLYTNWNDLAAK